MKKKIPDPRVQPQKCPDPPKITHQVSNKDIFLLFQVTKLGFYSLGRGFKQRELILVLFGLRLQIRPNQKFVHPKLDWTRILLQLTLEMVEDLLAAAFKLLCILKVIKGSGKFLKKALAALVIVLVSHSNGSSNLIFSNLFLSRPVERRLVTFEATPTSL